MNTKQVIIDIMSLSKQYRGTNKFSLSNVSLQVHAGEVYGFLGANGAGKSTIIRTLLNFIQPTEGSATILGKDIVKDNVDIKHHVGYLAGDVALYDKLSGHEFLAYMSALQPAPRPEYLTQLVTDFEVDLTKPISTLSKGNRQKIGILQALMHEPEVLILDEPTSGLDPLMQEVFFGAINTAKKRGASVFFSSHNLGEVQRICDRVGFIREGRLIREQSLSELAVSAAHTFDLVFEKDAPIKALQTLHNVEVSQGHDERHVTVSIPAESLSELFAILAKYTLRHFDQREVNLEEEFLNYYREDRDNE